MRDFRDAKAMAQSLRESLTTKSINISHSESLELVSRMLGVADWNTLSSLLQADRRDPQVAVAPRQTGTASYPVFPIRDLVPFPSATYPLFVGREKTMQALKQAFERQREVVLAIQRQSGVDEPGLEDVYEIGVLAQLLDVEPMGDGTLKVLTQARRRVAIRRFVGESGAFQADVADISEGPIPEASDLIQRAVKRFETYAAARDIRIPQISPPLDQTRDPGRVADIIASHMVLPVGGKQSQYATLEHLLLALIDDTDAAAVMEACNADLGAMKASLSDYLDNGLKNLVIENGGDAKPTAAFQRVTQRAELHAQELGRPVVTGTNTLFAIFRETLSPAAKLLGEQGVSRARAADFIAHGRGKDG